jgi:sortase A
MLVGGILAYPTIQSYMAPLDAQSLEFSITAAPPPTAVAVQPAPQERPTQPPSAEAPSQAREETVTPTPPAPLVLPETKLTAAQETPTAAEPEIAAEEQVTPETTPEPTPTPLPTPTPDPASLMPGRLVIPSIDLDAPVVKVGWETQEVNGQLVSSWIVPDTFAAGWHATSALPGSPGNTVLNGHHNIHGEVFRDLEDLQPGDEIILYTGQAPHYYNVTERHILKEKYEPQEVRQQNAQFIMPTQDERLTMVTCWPYTNNTHRLIIVALPMHPTPTPTPMVE